MGPDAAEHIDRYCLAIRRAYERGGMEGFEFWFNPPGKNVDVPEYRAGAYWNILQILTPATVENIPTPEDAVALEIGCGGGRLMAASCRFFRKVIGVDIHDQLDLTAELLDSQYIWNYELLRTDGQSIPVPDASVDFVYSFIVFMHLASVEQYVEYIRESYRVLKPGGVGQFFYKPSTRSDTYLQAVVGANEASLEMAPEYAERVVADAGFSIIDRGWSIKRDDSGNPVRGGQRYVTVRK